MTDEKWVVYLVRCSDNSLYCGISNDFERRLIGHNSGKGAKYTKSRRPVELVGISPEMTKSEALKLEYRIKRTPVDKKIAELKKTGLQISVVVEFNCLLFLETFFPLIMANIYNNNMLCYGEAMIHIN